MADPDFTARACCLAGALYFFLDFFFLAADFFTAGLGNVLGFAAFTALGLAACQVPSALSSRTDQYSQARATGPGRRLYSPANSVSMVVSGETWPRLWAWICIAALRAV